MLAGQGFSLLPRSRFGPAPYVRTLAISADCGTARKTTALIRIIRQRQRSLSTSTVRLVSLAHAVEIAEESGFELHVAPSHEINVIGGLNHPQCGARFGAD